MLSALHLTLHHTKLFLFRFFCVKQSILFTNTNSKLARWLRSLTAPCHGFNKAGGGASEEDG